MNEIKHGWFVMFVWFLLAASSLIADRWFGKGWALVTAIAAAGIWFLLKPWNLGLIPAHVRKAGYITGSVVLCGLIVVEAIRYWKR